MRRALVFTVALALLSAPRAWSQSSGQGGKAPAAAADHSADDQALAKIVGFQKDGTLVFQNLSPLSCSLA